MSDKLRVALFFDGANHSEACKAAKIRIDYSKLLGGFSTAHFIVAARYYSGVMPEPDEGKGVKDYLAGISKTGLSIITKPARTQSDGSVKANVDIEIAVDMLQMAPRLDKVILFSGDGDFIYLVDAVQRMGVHVAVCSHRQFTSHDLRDRANEFWDLTEIGTKHKLAK